MQINVIQLGLIKTNAYTILSDNAAIVIDPGFDSAELAAFLNQNRDKSRLILITHAHFDHIGGALTLREESGVQIGIGKDEAAFLSDSRQNLSDQFHAHIKPFTADRVFEDGEEITVGDTVVKVIETPGHTPGGVSYLIGDNLFSGDTLFLESVGRTDFPGGNFPVLQNSVKKLFQLGDRITVYPGHGEATTISHEKKYNTFI